MNSTKGTIDFQNMNERIACAYEIASNAHEGQLDKGGHPYLEHPMAVANLVSEFYDTNYSGSDDTMGVWEDELSRDDLIVVALLHDVLEDTDVTAEELSEKFDVHIVGALEALTRRRGELYMEYVTRTKVNPIARLVKMADLEHNMDISRITNPTHQDYERIELKYKPALEFLKK